MESTNFVVATVDQGMNLFKTIEGEISVVEHIAEHIKRLEEISDGHHFYIDDTMFKVLGEKNFPLRFTRVFSRQPKNIPMSQNYRIHNRSELQEIVLKKDRYSPDTQIFFIGASDFLIEATKYSKKLLLTVVERDYGDDPSIIDKFPLEHMQKIFKKRRSIHPELLAQIKQYQAIMKKKIESTKVTITDNSMILIEKVKPPPQKTKDEILNTPNYMFYEYSR